MLLCSQPGLRARVGPPLALTSSILTGTANWSQWSHGPKGSGTSKVKLEGSWNQDSLTFNLGIHSVEKNMLFLQNVLEFI